MNLDLRNLGGGHDREGIEWTNFNGPKYSYRKELANGDKLELHFETFIEELFSKFAKMHER